jgi:hypothetical protein
MRKNRRQVAAAAAAAAAVAVKKEKRMMMMKYEGSVGQMPTFVNICKQLQTRGSSVQQIHFQLKPMKSLFHVTLTSEVGQWIENGPDMVTHYGQVGMCAK